MGYAAALLTAVLVWAAAEPERPQFRIGEPAPPFVLTGLDGRKIDSKSLKGRPAVLFFAATWCPYSNRLSRAVETLHQHYKNKGVRVLLIDIKEEKEKAAAKWVAEKKMSCPVLSDSDGTVARAYGPPPDFEPKTAREDLMPATVILLDREGRIRQFPSPSENPGQIDWELSALSEQLDRLLAKKK